MIYKITQKENKTASTGTAYVSAVLVDGSGTEYKVNAFNGEFAGDVYDGELEKNGQYWNLPKMQRTKPSTFQRTEKLMEKKEQAISNAQDKKEESIKIASTMNKAVELAVAEYTKDRSSIDSLEELTLKWRKWLWMHWTDHEQYPPFLG